MAKTNGTILYPLKSGVNEDDANEAYASMTTEFSTGKAFKDVSVNPVLKATYVESETSGTGTAITDVIASVIFTEIRKGSHGGSISNDKADQIGNRLLPKNKTIANYATTKETTPPFKIKAFDTSVSTGETNRKFVYADTSLGASVIDYPATDVVALDIENYDYFVLLNPEIYDSSTQSDTARPHFAKITRISTFDEVGDGLEFSPKYHAPVPKGTNFEIFKGPAKTDTDVMAVSYGLRGDNQASTDNYDVLNRVDRPTFYFYNDRLEQDDQLDYMEKYTVTRLRWWDYNHGAGNQNQVGFLNTSNAYSAFEEGSSSKKLFVSTGSYSTFMNTVFQGMSLFDDATDDFVGNVKTINTSDNSIELDFSRQASSSTWNASGGGFILRYGKGIQNIVFRTEAKQKGVISNIGRRKLDATLVDNLRTTDDGDGNFNPILWHKAFPNMKRHTSDSTSATSSTLDGNRTGPSRYITADPRPRRNDVIPLTTDVIVNSPQNKMSKMFKTMAMNNSGMLPFKIRQGQTLKAMKTAFSDKVSFKPLPFKASKVDGANEIRFTDMLDTHDYALSTKLASDSIIKVDGYYYVINAIQSKSSGTQDVTVKANKTLNATSFTVAVTVHEFDNADVEIAHWTGVLNTENFDSDTQVVYADGNRLTISGTTIPKEQSKFFDSKVVFTSLSGHQNHVDYIDKDMEYVKFQDASRKFYQNTSVPRFYYYNDGYSLQEEVFDGIVELTETNAENGLSTLVVEGRDSNASLLNTLIDKNLLFSEDMAYSTLNPIVPALNTATMDVSGVSGKVITHAAISNWNTTALARTLLFTRSTTEADNMIFIGEVASVAGNNQSTTLTHKPLVNLSTSADTDIYYYDPHAEATYFAGKKAIGSNPLITNSATDFSRVSDKGLVFSDSFSFDRTGTRTKLESTSNTASFAEDRTLGYNISNPISINSLNTSTLDADSSFAIQLSKETGVSTTKINKMTYASEMFDVIETISKDDGGFIMSIAPICPIVMGRLEDNTSESRTNVRSLYLVNNNVNSGGFIHRADTQTGSTGTLDLIGLDDIYTPRETYRYWDLQKLSEGALTKSDAGIYTNADFPQAITGYSVAYPIKGNGVVTDLTSTQGIGEQVAVLGTSGSTITYTDYDFSKPAYSTSTTPVLGSNMIDDDYVLRYSTGSVFAGLATGSKLPKHIVNREGAVADNSARKEDIGKIKYHAPKAQNYELLVTGDLFPYSKLRYNNIGNSTLNFEDFACLVEAEGSKSSTQVSHSGYTGKTLMADKRDNNFERVSIKSANKTTNQIKRFGIARLIEATFDWHFNPVDPDSLPSPSDSLVDISGYQIFTQLDTTFNNTQNPSVTIGSSGSNRSITFSGGGTLSLAAGDAFFRRDTGDMVFVVNATITNMTSGSNQSALVNVTGSTADLNTTCYLIRDYQPMSMKIGKFDDEGFQKTHTTSVGGNTVDVPRIDFTSVYLARPNLSTEGSVFEYALLEDSGGDEFNPPSIFLPLPFESRTSGNIGSVNSDVCGQSPYHRPTMWHTANGITAPTSRVYMNSSRVIAGLVHGDMNASAGDELQRYGLEGDDHVYDNCIGVFRNIRHVSKEGPSIPEDMFQTSALLGSNDEVTAFGSYSAGTDLDQHSPNTMIFKDNTNQKAFALSGTHARAGVSQFISNENFVDAGAQYFLSDKEGDALTTDTFTHHKAMTTTHASNTGGLYRAQMMIKPVLDVSSTAVSIDSGATNKIITITLNTTSNTNQSDHAWLNFVPNLTGYYLVAERQQEETSDINLGSISGLNSAYSSIHPNAFLQSSGGNIGYLAKILSHTTNQTQSNATSVVHTITVDTNLPTEETSGSFRIGLGPRYRIMRLAETTFKNTPKEIVLNRLHSTGLDYSETSSNFLTGAIGETIHAKNYINEGVFSAYVLMNLDTAPSGTQRIVPSSVAQSFANLPYSDGDTFDCFITDGTNSERKTITVSNTSKDIPTSIRRDEFKLTYEGTLTGNGVVSFGEVIDLELSRKPNLDKISKCHIGTSMIIGEEVETEIERIIKEAGLDVDMVQTQAEFTGNIVSSVSNNVITCKATVENIADGDIIFTHEGYPIGSVSSTSGTTITVNDVDTTDTDVDLWFVPLVNDEIIKFNKKTFVSTDNFVQASAFQMLNKLAGKKNLDFSVNNKKVVFRDLNSAPLLRKQGISYRSHRVFSVKKNSSLFARANKVTVIGDRIKTSVSSDDTGTHIKFIDANIRSITDAKVKAIELLELHSSDARKITLNVEKKGLETLEAGDIVFLDFPQYDIPPNDYIIFEIENVLTPTLTMTVGTFDKTIAERLSEIGTQQSASSSTLFSRNSQQVSTGKTISDSISLKTTLVQYTITGTGETANMGFDDLFGFGETLGFETTAGQVIGYYTSED